MVKSVSRGATRLCPDLYRPGQHKQFFNVFDYCQNLEFFSQNPDHADGSATESLSTRLFKARLEMVSDFVGTCYALATHDDSRKRWKTGAMASRVTPTTWRRI